MQTKLISVTQAVPGLHPDNNSPMTAEQLIVYVARVSNPSNQNNTDTYTRLIRYLIKHHHWSPFEQAHMTIEVKTSRAIAAQILRHWSFRFQEFSQRYAEAVEFEPVELRQAPAAGQTRQGSGEAFDPELDFNCYTGKASEAINDYLQSGLELYKELLDAGVAKEVARMILPLTTQTTIYLTADVRNWIFYLKQRTDPHAQKEHRDLAFQCRAIFKNQFPNISTALYEEGVWNLYDNVS